MNVVVDASVVVKWYIPERDHHQARAVRDGYLEGRHDLLAPTLLPFEVVNALRYSGHYEGARLEEASETLPEYGIDLVPYRELGPVATIAETEDVTIYDASYVSLAVETDGVVYTADDRLLGSLGAQYDEVVEHVREYPA